MSITLVFEDVKAYNVWKMTIAQAMGRSVCWKDWENGPHEFDGKECPDHPFFEGVS